MHLTAQESQFRTMPMPEPFAALVTTCTASDSQVESTWDRVFLKPVNKFARTSATEVRRNKEQVPGADDQQFPSSPTARRFGMDNPLGRHASTGGSSCASENWMRYSLA